MKKYIYIGIAGTVLILCMALSITLNLKNDMEKKWKDAMENVKAYSEQCSSSESKNKAMKLTIEQLESYKDSILMELNTARKELGIKDSKIKSMQYLASGFTKNDTIILKDTIFKDPQINIDTLLCDDWYSVRVGLKYPSTVSVKPEFKSKKYIFVSTKKETVNPPKKFFLWRWFQKKHTVVNVDIIEQNPYISGQTNRYIEIVE